MSIDHISWKTNLERTTDIRVLEFADQVYLYERREIVTPLNSRIPEKPVETFVQGVVDGTFLDAIKRGQLDDVVPFDPTLGSKADAGYFPMLISDRGLEVIRVEGHPFAHHNVLEKLTKSGDLVRKGGASFIDCLQNGFSEKNIFFASVQDHSIVDLLGTPIVVPFQFSYLEGLSSDRYDLGRVLDVVKENGDVEIHRDRYGIAEQLIPNYGDPDAPVRYGVTLTWRPTKESWEKFLADAEEKGLKTKFVSFRAYDLLKTYDVLGIAGNCPAELDVEASGPRI